MRRYQTDGGATIDFFSEIDNIDLNEEENICLISNLPLDDTHITLKCGHKFNYKPLFNDITNVKSRHQMLVKRLDIDQIQCPYCRNIQKCLLPYIPKLRLPKKDGVNWINANKYFSHRVYSKMGNCSVVSCEKNVQTIWDDDKVKEPYCFMHYNRKYPKSSRSKKPLLTKSFDKPVGTHISKQKESPLIDMTTPLVNEVINIVPDDNNNNNNQININKDMTNASEETTLKTCCVILKSGIRKGNPCGAKAKINGPFGGVCLRHKNWSC